MNKNKSKSILVISTYLKELFAVAITLTWPPKKDELPRKGARASFLDNKLTAII